VADDLISAEDAWIDDSDTSISMEATSEYGDDQDLRRHRLVRRHWSMLRIALLTVLLSCLLQVRPDQRVAPQFGPNLTLPELCGSRIMWKMDCPGCGLTRSFISIAHGDIWRAWSLNRVSWLLAVALLLQFPYRWWRLRQLKNHVISEHRWPAWCGVALPFLLVVNWILKLLGI
jgi:hypothetical protein